jgi:hypothetical protein
MPAPARRLRFLSSAALLWLCALLAACGGDAPAPRDASVSDLSIDGGDDLGADLGPPDLGVDLPGCPDADGDGVPSAACGGGDCDDADPTRYPGAVEVCDDDDEDCDDATLGPDADGDGAPYRGCCNGAARCGADCDDARPSVNASGLEACNGADDDCDGAVDEGVLTFACEDRDGDGRGDARRTSAGCSVPLGSTTTCNDCDDTDPSRYLGAFEQCNGVDDDCDGAIDEGCECMTGAMRDCGESVGACEPGRQRCLGTPGFWETTCAGATSPDIEVCDGADDDCDGTIDEGVQTTYFADCDADGAGDSRTTVADCARPDTNPPGCARALWVTEGGDCDDRNPLVGARPGCVTDMDAGVPDAGFDAGIPDLGVDAGTPDFGVDGGIPDLGVDMGTLDFGVDAGTPDLGVDAGTPDLGVDAGRPFAESTIRRVVADVRGSSDLFGEVVALSADGTTLAVGAPGEASASRGLGGDPFNNGAMNSGAAYVFRKDTLGVWTQEVFAKASNADPDDSFGQALALSADGSVLVVGAPGEASSADGVGGLQDDNGRFGAGAVYVFRRSVMGVWSQEAYVKAGNSERSYLFGDAISISADGTVLAIGSRWEASAAVGVDPASASADSGRSGAVYLFRYNGATWERDAFIKATNTDAVDEFGCAVSLSGDGLTLAVGARYEASASTGVDNDGANNLAPSSGAVYVLSRASGAWLHEAYIKASNTDSGDRFGTAVALSFDGTTLLVGAPAERAASTGVDGDQSSNLTLEAGAAYVFEREGGLWSQRAYLKALDVDQSDNFGEAVAVAADASTLAVGSPLEDASDVGVGAGPSDDATMDSGAVYVYRRSGATWFTAAFLKTSPSCGACWLGGSVALSETAETLAAGAIRDDGVTGAVYVY